MDEDVFAWTLTPEQREARAKFWTANVRNLIAAYDAIEAQRRERRSQAVERLLQESDSRGPKSSL